jgi:glycosyltransferase involved in cell wall biosynthesis
MDLAISAVICTYDRYDLLPKAIASLEHQTLPSNAFEIIVVDNSPDRERSERVASEFRPLKNLRWIHEQKPGLSNARNVGAGRARAPLVAFMDDDAVASPAWLRCLVSAFREFGPSAQAAGGRVAPIWGADRPNWLPDDLLGYVSVVNWGGTARVAGPKEWVAGTNIAFRTEALQNAGGFSVGLGRNKGSHALLSNDEIEIVQRLGTAGGQLLYVPEAVVEHLVPPERLTQAWFRRRVAWQAVSDYLQIP